MKTLAVTCEDEKMIPLLKDAGADELIIALSDACFSALQTFDLLQAPDIIEKAHAQGMKISILMNRLFHETDVPMAKEQMNTLLSSGADAVIFADLALAFEAKKQGTLHRLIYQPETMMTSSFDASAWLDTGIQGVSLSMLMTREEILQICSSAGNVSVCVHGFQLMSVSARSLLSAYGEKTGIRQLKGNRNLYLQEEKRESLLPVYENDYAAMIFSDYIQESFDDICSYARAGAQRFVIDSWHLPIEAVTDAAAIYRHLLDETRLSLTPQEYREKYSDLPLSTGYYDLKTVR